MIIRYSSATADSAGVFYTDSNGRQFVKRVRDHRFEFDYNPEEELEPVAANYYPVTNCEFKKYVIYSSFKRLIILVIRYL